MKTGRLMCSVLRLQQVSLLMMVLMMMMMMRAMVEVMMIGMGWIVS